MLPLHIALLASGYFVAGKLALLLAIPPGYATAVWPAAGLALAACLVWGSRVWPGIFLGSLLVNVGTSFDGSSVAALFDSLTLPSAIAAGACLQAVCGGILIRRLVGFPLSLNRLPGITLMVVVGGPVSCLISASLGILALTLAGRIVAGDLLTHWFTWWVGDSLGVAVLVPLVAAWKMELQQTQRLTRLSVILPLLVAVTLTVGLFLHVRGAEWRNRKLVFASQAEHLAQAVRTNLQIYHDVLFSIEGLFQSSQQVDRNEFQQFVAYAFQRHPGIQALEWVPRVRAEERADYELRARADGFTNFAVTERTPDGRLVPATERAEYAPVYYLEPYRGNEAALGFDLASSTSRREALHLARDSGKPVATQRITLVQGGGEDFGILLMIPIYTGAKIPETMAERQQQYLGAVCGVFHIPGMVEAALKPLAHEGFALSLYDLTAAFDEQFLYARPDLQPPHLPPTERLDPGTLGWEQQFEVGTRRWLLRLTPTAANLAGQQLWGAWAVLTGGLFFSSLLGSFLLLVVGRKVMTERVVTLRTADLQESNRQLEEEVSERERAQAELQLARAELENRVEIRTAELRQSNQHLQQEILDHRQSQERLHASESRFRRLVQAAPDGIVIMDAEHRIALVNDQTERLFGYDRNELRGELHSRLLPERYRERHERHQAEFLNSPSIRPMGSELELFGLRKDGSEFPLEISLSPLATPEGMQVICIVRDITLRKQTELELQNHRTRLEELVAERTRELEEKSADLEKATRLKSEFLANMSHELRTPMNSIIGFTERVLKTSAEVLPERQVGNLRTVRRNAHQLLELINSLLDIAKIEAGRMEVFPESFDLQVLLQEVLELTEPLAAEKGLQLQLQAADADLGMESDRGKLRQILVNLIGNAIKFTEEGSIRLQVGPNADAPDRILIQVSDTGPGIAPEQQALIFEAFVQGDGSDKRRSGGTGLGLAIVKNFVTLLQGEIRLASRPGAGTTLELSFPRTLEPAAPAAAGEQVTRSEIHPS